MMNAFQSVAPISIPKVISPAERRAQLLKLQATALRVNRQDFSISPTPQADKDRFDTIAGRRVSARCQ